MSCSYMRLRFCWGFAQVLYQIYVFPLFFLSLHPAICGLPREIIMDLLQYSYHLGAVILSKLWLLLVASTPSSYQAEVRYPILPQILRYYSYSWKVRQNEWNCDRSENARRPKAKTFPTRKRLARNGICRRERHVHDVCRDICWQKTNLLTTKICW